MFVKKKKKKKANKLGVRLDVCCRELVFLCNVLYNSTEPKSPRLDVRYCPAVWDTSTPCRMLQYFCWPLAGINSVAAGGRKYKLKKGACPVR